MILFTPFVIVTFTAVGNVVSETYKKAGDKAVLSPGSVSGPITSITWKHGADLAVEWYGEQPIEYRDFKGRCEVNNNTGALTITNLSVKDSGRYTAEINNRVMKTTEIRVITAVPKPTIKKQCNPEVTQCTLTCNASITADMGTVTYSWATGDRQIPDSPSNQLNITKNDKESVEKLISCQLKNPVSSERSDDIMSPITNESSAGVITAAVVTLLFLIVAALVGVICWHKRRPGNADQSWVQYFSRFILRNCLNCGRTNQETEEENRREQAETAKLMSENANGAAIPANQHQPEAEPTGTNKEAEKPESTLNIENEAGPDQTPADSTDPSSEAATSSESQTMKNQDQPEPDPTETSAGAPNAEEPPDHHHQQEDETTE